MYHFIFAMFLNVFLPCFLRRETYISDKYACGTNHGLFGFIVYSLHLLCSWFRGNCWEILSFQIYAKNLFYMNSLIFYL